MNIIKFSRQGKANGLLAFACALLLAACGGGGGGTSPATQTLPDPVLSGPTSFVSADIQLSSGLVDDKSVVATAVPAAASTPAPTSRTTEQGDIYRLLDGGKTILNLNAYRGLQIIDIGNPSAPSIVGRVALTGNPVEMYRVGERVYVLLNNWAEYKRVSKGGQELLDSYSGAAIITVDISSRSAPKVMGTTRLGGYISSSRLSSGGGKVALYVAGIDYGSAVVASAQTVVQSFAVTAAGTLEAKSSINLGGYVSAIQAAADRLLVARYQTGVVQQASSVSVIDISSPDGVMVQGADVAVSGQVQKKNNMDVQGNILRVVSSNFWQSSNNTNHVETFNIADLAHPKAVDHDTFGDGQQLFGTTFLADRAFFVTYFRRDPFHAFSITADGVMKEESQFIVSGWNDFFVPVNSDSRLIGIGRNDEANVNEMAVSLYDISNLANAKPLLSRATLNLANGWTEASWDDRGFSVVENATSVLAADGKTTETGLVLLPFSGWDVANRAYHSGVQILSFSANTLTLRGVMKQDTQVRRSFIGDSASGTAANLSDSELSLFTILNPDAPVAKASMPLAPSYSQFVAMPNVGVRYRARDFSWWSSASRDTERDVLEFVPLDGADGNTVLATLEVPQGSKLYNVGEKLAVVSGKTSSTGFETTIAAYDVSTAAKPVLLGSMTTNELSGQSDFVVALKVRACGIVGPCGGYGVPTANVVGNALVFASQPGQYVSKSATDSRYWTSYVLQVVDLSNPAKPALLPKLSMPTDEEAVKLVVDKTTLWVNYKKPQPLGPDGLAQAKFFVKALDLSTSSSPKLGTEVNIPGQLMAAAGEALYTYDYNWNAKVVDTKLALVVVRNNLAYLQATLPLAGQSPGTLLLDGTNVYALSYDQVNYAQKLSVITYSSQKFTVASTLPLDSYAWPKAARNGRLLMQGAYGVLVYDVRTPASPFPSAYLATYWGGEPVFLDNQVFIASGPYGMFSFSLDTVNLSKP